MSTVSDAELQTTVALVKSLLNSQLKTILRHEQLAVSGVKNTLQFRILNHLQRLSQNPQQFDRLKKYIYHVAQYPFPPPTPPLPTFPQSSLPSPQPQSAHRSQYPAMMTAPPSQSSGHLLFKESPFYTILEPLTPVVECRKREATKDTVEFSVIFTESLTTRLQNEPNLRIMLYCAADNALGPYTRSDIAFPHQVELKVNLDDVKTNLRGLKNRPGTTRPADITNFLRKKANFSNCVTMTYALTTKRFFAVVNLVRKQSVEELVEKLKTRASITAEQVLREMKTRAEDTEIVATSSVMSLKCPLSTLRITIPCRTAFCTHNQCFDAASFLQLQEQAPTWSCPVCNKITSFESLQIDQYVDNILKATSSDTEQVTIEPDGAWSIPGDNPSTDQGPTPNGDDDGDLIEIYDPRVACLKQEPTSYPLSLQTLTPTRSSREASSVSSAQRPSTNKRPASQVIDLTLSDDEEAVRPAKRPAYDTNPSLNGFRRQSYDYRSNYTQPLPDPYNNY